MVSLKFFLPKFKSVKSVQYILKLETSYFFKGLNEYFPSVCFLALGVKASEKMPVLIFLPKLYVLKEECTYKFSMEGNLYVKCQKIYARKVLANEAGKNYPSYIVPYSTMEKLVE